MLFYHVYGIVNPLNPVYSGGEMQNSRPIRYFSPLDLPICLFLISACLAVVPAWDRSLTRLPLMLLLGGGALYTLVSRVGTGKRGIQWMLRAATLLCGVIALYFVTQYGHYIETGKVGLITRIAHFTARVFPAAGLMWQPTGNSMATLLEGLAFVCAGAWFVEKQRVWRFVAGAAVLLTGLGVLLSESRGAWLAVVLAALVWLAVRSRFGRWLAWIVFAAAALLAAWVILANDVLVLERIPLVGRLLTSLFFRPDRMDVYRGSLNLIQDQPFTGLGLGEQFPLAYSRYVLLIQVPFLYYSHNFYLETWLQTGLAGITALLWLISGVYLLGWRLQRNWLAEGAWVGLTAVFIHGLTDARQYSDLWTWFPFFFLLGLLSAAWLRSEKPVRAGWFVWLPPTVPLLVLAVVLMMRSPIAVWQANLGSLEQARVELPAMQNRYAVRAQLGSAEARLRESIRRMPDQRSANLRLGLLLTDREDFTGAVEFLEAALRADPKNLTTQKALGLAYTWAGKIDLAAKTLAGIPGIVEELNQYAWWRETSGARHLARNAVQVSLTLSPDQPVLRDMLQRLGK